MNSPSTSVVITSISAPNDVMRAFAKACSERGINFIVIGDVPSPPEFALDGCEFLGIAEQLKTSFETARLVPTRHYARKNIGYLLAIAHKSNLIIETDDDNFPIDSFWDFRERQISAAQSVSKGWLNVYKYFSDSLIWPRGLPLDCVTEQIADWSTLSTLVSDCPIQQGLADDNPDVDAIYRLLLPLPVFFRKDRRVALGKDTWCPFNSQNTTWFQPAFPLLYLPAYCSFRMTDIWRSFIAQRIAWTCGWSILFHEPTVFQLRNDHSLMRDFQDEVPGYLNNRNIADLLGELSLRDGEQNLSFNLLACYEELVRNDIFPEKELPLVQAWITDLTHANVGG